MKKFYFTFGLAHGNADHYQVIFAKSEQAAHQKMHQMHGKLWAFGYNAEQWALSKQDGFFKDLTALRPVYAFAS